MTAALVPRVSLCHPLVRQPVASEFDHRVGVLFGLHAVWFFHALALLIAASFARVSTRYDGGRMTAAWAIAAHLRRIAMPAVFVAVALLIVFATAPQAMAER
jgi:hypothetical protein